MRKILLSILLLSVVLYLSNEVTHPLAFFLAPGDGTFARLIRGVVTFCGEVLFPWIAFIPFILLAYKAFPIAKERLISSTAFHLLVCALLSYTKAAAHVFVFHFNDLMHVDNVFEAILVGGFLGLEYDVFFYSATIAVIKAVEYIKKYRQKELAEARLAQALATAELHSLKMKLQPHFLFNALQSISVLVLEQKVDAATEMLEELGNLLRVSMESDESQLVPLEKELQVLDYYLAIEEIRFVNRLRVEKRIEDSARAAFVPNIVLQPLVENSIKHGVSKRIEPGRVLIDIRCIGKQLCIQVCNDGPTLQDDWRSCIKRGIGLSSTLKRLELLFKESFSFDMRNLPEGGVVTEVTIPLITDTP